MFYYLGCIMVKNLKYWNQITFVLNLLLGFRIFHHITHLNVKHFLFEVHWNLFRQEMQVDQQQQKTCPRWSLTKCSSSCVSSVRLLRTTDHECVNCQLLYLHCTYRYSIHVYAGWEWQVNTLLILQRYFQCVDLFIEVRCVFYKNLS